MHHLQKVNHFIMKYLLMARNSLWMNVHIMSSQKMISQRKVRQVQKHQHRSRRRRKLMQTRQAHFIHIRREWRNIFQSRQHFILTIRIIGLWYQSQLMRIQKGLQFKMIMGFRFNILHEMINLEQIL